MKEITLEKLKILLSQNLNVKFSIECLKCINSEIYTFKEGSVTDRDQLYQIYYTRLQIQTDITHSEINYNDLLQNLKSFKDDKVSIMIIRKDVNAYIIFTDESVSFLIAILKSDNSKNPFADKLEKLFRKQ